MQAAPLSIYVSAKWQAFNHRRQKKKARQFYSGFWHNSQDGATKQASRGHIIVWSSISINFNLINDPYSKSWSPPGLRKIVYSILKMLARAVTWTVDCLYRGTLIDLFGYTRTGELCLPRFSSATCIRHVLKYGSVVDLFSQRLPKQRDGACSRTPSVQDNPARDLHNNLGLARGSGGLVFCHDFIMQRLRGWHSFIRVFVFVTLVTMEDMPIARLPAELSPPESALSGYRW